jgi:1-deoxy-D-xylulose-5-phosphate reductoisomerase
MGNLHMGRYPLRPLVILGVTGSIGRQALDVADRIGAPIHGIAAHRGSRELIDVARSHPAVAVCATDLGADSEALAAAIGRTVHTGPAAMVEMAATPGVTVVNGIVGAAGLEASLSALQAGNRLALANKESLVTGGPLVVAAANSGGGELIPVDSEHSAIWQCIVGEPEHAVARVILTASGGPFRGLSLGQLASVTVEQALDHPTWAMGPRITTDSATMMNKAFEVVEAHYLFGLSYDAIDVVVHPQSIIHSFVEFVDGVVKAEVGFPDMRKPIQAAITHPARIRVDHAPMDLVGTELTFESPDHAAFPALHLGYEAGRAGGTATAVLNAADEVAVEAFLAGRIPFPSIATVVSRVLHKHVPRVPESVADVMDADAWARAEAGAACTSVAD